MPEAWRKGSSSWDGTDRLANAGLAWLRNVPLFADLEPVVYHRGDLAIDAPARVNADAQALRVRLCASRMARAADMGLVRLVQRRLADHDYEYIAQRRR